MALRWWQHTGDDLAKALWETATQLEQDQQARVFRARENLSRYENRELTALDAESYMNLGAGADAYKLPIVRNLCDTVHSEIAGRQKPVPKFQTSGASWRKKRRAKKLGKFCEAVIRMKHRQYPTGWALMEDCFLDAAVWGVGTVKPIWNNGRVLFERHYDHELFVDPEDAKYGAPGTLYHVYTMDRDLAEWHFADDPSLDLSEEKRRAIRESLRASSPGNGQLHRDLTGSVQKVKVVEGWHLPVGRKPRVTDSEEEEEEEEEEADKRPKDPDERLHLGCHAFAIADKLLHEEDWARDGFGFVRMRWQPDRIGWGGSGLTDQAADMQEEMDRFTERVSERVELCANKRIFVEAGSLKDITDLQANEAENIITYERGRQPPTETRAQPIADAELAYGQFVLQNTFEMTGVSQPRASARKEPGVTAGVAIRTLNDMQSARFALRAKEYENAYIELARQIIHCAKEAYEAGEEVVAVLDGEEISWEDVQMPEEDLDISIAPTSSLPNDPAGRMQMVQELYSAGLFGPDTFKQLLGWPDLEKEMQHQTAQRRYLERVFDEMLDNPDAEKVSPDPYLIDKADALLQAGQVYFEALYDGAPEEALDKIRTWLNEMVASIQVEAIGRQMVQGAPGAEGIPGGPEGEEGQQEAPGGPATANRPPVAEAG